jgi:urease accessory protein
VIAAGARPATDTPEDAPRVGRDGSLALRFVRRGERTVMSGCRWTTPLQVMAPLALEDPAAVVSLLNPTGGLVGGDRLSIVVEAGAGAHACLTTPSATRVYRTTGDVAVQTVSLRVDAGALVEWVPDHLIPSAGAAFRQSIEVELAGDAALVLVDAFAAGRVARGEAWRFTRLETTLDVRDPRGRIFRDRLCLDGRQAWDGLGMSESCPYLATAVIVGGPGAVPLLADLAGLGDGRSAVGAAALPRRGVVVRACAASAPALTAIARAIWGAARRHLGLPVLDLRKS